MSDPPAAGASEFEQRIEDLKTEGWRVKERESDRAVLYQRQTGSLVAHILLFLVTFWTLGIANLFYLMWKYSNPEKKVVRPGD